MVTPLIDKNILQCVTTFFTYSRNVLHILGMKRLRKVNFILFQQDGAPPHFDQEMRQLLDNVFPNRQIGKDSPI
jgi:hypothetical protein